MNFQIKLISIIFLYLLFTGCAKPEIIYKTEYKEVKVPVIYKIERPNRPTFESTDTIPIYLLKVLKYTQSLELIIDEYNQGL